MCNCINLMLCTFGLPFYLISSILCLKFSVKRGGKDRKTKNKDKRIFYIKVRCFKETIWQNKLIKPNHCNIQAKKRERPGELV